ncbi:hypothetical protein DID77_02585 [Candidatus Marinamargulisbacteria bacterium SCGC AG-439-L15]|nr:hypothetical protein DID77_02585 [Candidatus Marinamargulisbacteria bacterium SCGC AG-439-L15]
MLGIGILLTSHIQAEENLWIYTKGTDTRPKGSYELKISDIVRIGKGNEDYVFHDIRPEIEYGLSDKLTVGVELMYFDHDYSIENEDLNPMYETQGGAGKRISKTQFGGYEVALKYNFLSPYKDIIGLSMGLGYEKRRKYRLDGADISQHSFVHTVFIQKNWLDDTLAWASNLKTELETRRSPGIEEKEIALDFSTGVSYRIAPKHFIGLEFRHQSDYLSPYNTETGEYEDPSLKPSKFGLTHIEFGTQHQNGNYIGPTYHYAEKNWWFTTGILFQFAGGGSEHAFVENNKNYDEHENVHFGMIYGYEF